MNGNSSREKLRNLSLWPLDVRETRNYGNEREPEEKKNRLEKLSIA